MKTQYLKWKKQRKKNPTPNCPYRSPPWWLRRAARGIAPGTLGWAERRRWWVLVLLGLRSNSPQQWRVSIVLLAAIERRQRNTFTGFVPNITLPSLKTNIFVYLIQRSLTCTCPTRVSRLTRRPWSMLAPNPSSRIVTLSSEMLEQVREMSEPP